MDLNLPSILTDSQVVFFGGTIALLVAVLQQISFIPLSDGSKARAWAVSVAAAVFVGLSTSGTGLTGAELALALILSWIALASAALGINRAGSFTVQSVKASTSDGSAG